MANAPTPNDLTRQQLDELDALLQKMLALPLTKPEPEPAAKEESKTTSIPSGWRADPALDGGGGAPHLTEAARAAPIAAESVHAPIEISWQVLQEPTAQASAPAPVTARDAQPSAETSPRIVPPMPSTDSPPMAPTPQPMPSYDPTSRYFSPPTAEKPLPTNVPSMPSVSGYGFDRIPMASPAPTRSEFNPVPPAPAEVPLSPAPMPSAASSPAPPIASPSAAMPAAPSSMSAVIKAEPEPRMEFQPPPDDVPLLLLPLFGMNRLIEGILNLFGPAGQCLMHSTVKSLLGTVGIALILAASLWTARGMGWLNLPLESWVPAVKWHGFK